MKNKVSELMDGELDTEDAEALIAQLKNKNELHDGWKTFHLIGDSLRESSLLSIDVSQQVSKRLESEPSILVSFVPRSFRRKMVALSVAASLVVMVTGWLSMQVMQQPQQTLIADNKNKESLSPPIHAVNTTPIPAFGQPLDPQEIDDYLYVHGEFSPGTAIRGVTTHFVHPVTDMPE